MEVEFDPAKAAANLKKHRISFAHAEQSLRDPLAVTIEDPDASEEARFVTLGADAFGRILIVINIPREERTRIISARRESPSEVKAYHA
jgi:uncharacterized DUF497 family protein